jgi:hypothetical protein
VRFIALKIDVGDTDFRKADIGAPAFDVGNQSFDGIVIEHKAAIMLDNAANRCMNDAACPNPH